MTGTWRYVSSDWGAGWADRSRPTIAASRGGGSKLNRGLSGLFKIFLKFFYLYLSDVHVEMKYSRMPLQSDKAYDK